MNACAIPVEVGPCGKSSENGLRMQSFGQLSTVEIVVDKISKFNPQFGVYSP
jgi:hypothetical protein